MVKPSERLYRSLTVDNLWQYVIKALRKPKYAYELSSELKSLNANMVTVYAVLYKLELGGYIRRAFSRKGNGPLRKYYISTRKGLDELKIARRALRDHLKNLNSS